MIEEYKKQIKYEHDNLIAYIRTKLNNLTIDKIHYLIYFTNKISTNKSGIPMFDINCYYHNNKITTNYTKNKIEFDRNELSEFNITVLDTVIKQFGNLTTTDLGLIVSYDGLRTNEEISFKQFIQDEDCSNEKYKLKMYELFLKEHSINIKI